MGHNFHVKRHFKFGVENGEKLGQLQLSTIHMSRERQQLHQQFMLKRLIKT
jgi:hypothetical protein